MCPPSAVRVPCRPPLAHCSSAGTRTPLIRRTVQEIFDRKPHTELNPDEVVALGAAVQANILDRGVQNMLLLDVTPLSLGIET